MNIEIIKTLKERAKKMLEDNYDRKIGDEEIYTIICELENFYTAYEKEKEKREKLEYEALEAKEYIKRLKECHLQYEEMTGIELLLPEKEE